LTPVTYSTTFDQMTMIALKDRLTCDLITRLCPWSEVDWTWNGSSCLYICLVVDTGCNLGRLFNICCTVFAHGSKLKEVRWTFSPATATHRAWSSPRYHCANIK
jgi:hypothetical protein